MREAAEEVVEVVAAELVPRFPCGVTTGVTTGVVVWVIGDTLITGLPPDTTDAVTGNWTTFTVVVAAGVTWAVVGPFTAAIV